MHQGKNKHVEKASLERGYQNQTQVTTVHVIGWTSVPSRSVES